MGIMVSGLKLIKPAYDFCLQMIPKVATRNLQRDMEALVHDCFTVLKPLSSELKTVARIHEIYGTKEILIGEWIRHKSGHQKLGSLSYGADETFRDIREYGEQMKPLVRRAISNEFCSLVDLAKQLLSYKDLKVKIEIPPTEVCEYACPSGNPIDLETKVIYAIGIETQEPIEILLFQEGKKDPEIRKLTDESKTPLFEDIVSYLVDLFKKADAEVSKVREHNEKIMEQMNQIVAPMKIANSLKG